MRKVTWLRRLALSTTTLLAVLAAGEVALRLTTETPLYIADPKVGSKLRPDITARFRSVDVDQVVVTNSHGFHDEEYPLEKPPDTYRILVLGDSYMEALQVSVEETFAKVLQRSLDGRLDRHRVQVINTGRSGRGVLEEYAVLRAIGWDFRPDLVLLAFVMNDVHDDWSHRGHLEIDAEGRPLGFRTQGISPLPLWLKAWMHRSRFVYFLLERLSLLHQRLQARRQQELRDAARTSGNPPPALGTFDILRPEVSPEMERAWELTTKTLTLLDRECRDRDVPFVLMVIPSENQFYSRETPTTRFWQLGASDDRPQRVLAECARKAGFPLLDLLPRFREAEQPLHALEGHWNARGHGLAAGLAAEFLLERVLPGHAIPESETRIAPRGAPR